MRIVFETLGKENFKYIATYTDCMTKQLTQRMLDYPDHYFYSVDITPDMLKRIGIKIVDMGDCDDE